MKTDSVEQFKHAGFNVRIEFDDDPLNPRKEYDNAGSMVCFHSRYNLGDKSEFNSPDEFREWWNENGKGGVIMPLYLYDHSGITMSARPFACPWDSGQVGWIYATRDTILKEWGKGNRVSPKARKLAEKCLLSEVETYDEYLTGQVYGFVIEDENEEEVGSCWGFFGLKYCIEEAKSEAEGHARSAIRKHCAELKSKILSKVGLEYRQPCPVKC